MADNSYSTSNIPTSGIGEAVYSMHQTVLGKRLTFERRWYDNNFFDDGFHYRFYSRAANKIIDISDRATTYSPMRAIPKASRQIRGIANLMVAPDYVPIVYPEKVDRSRYPDAPQMGQQQPPQGGEQPTTPYQQAMQQAKDYAHKTGRWLLKEWEYQDLIEKLALMVILSAKHGVAWMQVWPDAVDEKIKTQVYDAFDIYVNGELTDPSDAPFMIKAIPQLISVIKANENFDPDQLANISPDNRYASSDIKEAYMSTRYNKIALTEASNTLILKEAYIKEYLDEYNMPNIRKQDDGEEILKGKDKGDMVMRQVFVAGNVWLRDRYVNLPDYPFIDFRFEPGPIYQVPLIERFIPLNKSLDALVSRAERYSHTMVSGIWIKKPGEQFKITNEAGGQIVEASTPPTQGNIAPIPQFFFELMNMMSSLIQEQGANVAIGGNLPSGVQAHAAIESIKENEYSNLVIPQRRLKATVKRIAERMLDIADSHFITPQTVYDMKDGEPDYFDVIGASALEGRKKLKVAPDGNVVPLKKDYHVQIEAEPGMAYTKEGQKEAAKQLGDYLIQLAQLQLVSPEVVKVFFKQLLETYSFGATQDIMEAMEKGDMTHQLSEEQQTQMKIALLSALQDAGEVGQPASQKRVQESALGALQAIKDTGLADGQAQNPKDQVEIEQMMQEMKMKQEEHEMRMRQMSQELGIEQDEAEVDLGLKKAQVAHNMTIKEEQSQHSMKIKEKMADKMPAQPAKKGASK